MLEILFVDPSDYCFVDPIGEIILDHRNDFLSKKIKHTFMGYSVSQLKRIKSHKKWIMNPVSKPPTREALGLPEHTLIPQDQLMAASAEVKKELDKFNVNFLDGLEESTKIEIQGAMAEMLGELKITSDQHWSAAARRIGLTDNLIEVMQKERTYSFKKKEWDQYQNWKKTRNPARAVLEEKFGFDCKNAYHLVRLIRMCKEILTTGEVIVKRPDREELLAIRRGAWTYEQLIEFAEKEEKEINLLYKTTNVLPNQVDKEKLDNLCIKLIERSLSKYSWYNVQKFLKNTFKL